MLHCPSAEGTTTVVTWTYDDGNGNTVTQTQDVVINDVTAPVPDVASLPDVTGECSTAPIPALQLTTVLLQDRSLSTTMQPDLSPGNHNSCYLDL